MEILTALSSILRATPTCGPMVIIVRRERAHGYEDKTPLERILNLDSVVELQGALPWLADYRHLSQLQRVLPNYHMIQARVDGALTSRGRPLSLKHGLHNTIEQALP